jgi:hypothetical protein
MRVGRALLTLLVTLVIAVQVTAACPALPVADHAVVGTTQSQDCGSHGAVGDDASALEVRRGVTDSGIPLSVLVVPAAPPTGATGRRPLRQGGRRAPAAGRALLHRLCIART